MNGLVEDSSEQVGRNGPVAARRGWALPILAARIWREISVLDPAYFALVMATGIVSNTLFLEGEHALSDLLLAVNLFAYPLLWLLTGLRAARFPRAIGADLINPRRVFLFFTAVAATDVLGMSIGLRGFTTIALVMWLFAFALWFTLIYLGFGVLMLRNKAGDADVAEGAWLNAIVGTQSLVIVGGAVALPALRIAPQAFVLLPMLWGIGLILYGIFVALLSYRFFFAELEGRMTPRRPCGSSWALRRLASTRARYCVARGGATPFLRSLQPFLGGVTLATWALGWLLVDSASAVCSVFWNHGVHPQIEIGYTPMLWSIRFSSGHVCRGDAAFVRELRPFRRSRSLSWAMTWVALAAWCATGVGSDRRLAAERADDIWSRATVRGCYFRPWRGKRRLIAVWLRRICVSEKWSRHKRRGSAGN